MAKVIKSELEIAIEELLSSYEFVISWHFWFNRFPEWISSTSNYISIKQKLKLKCYLWIKKTEKKWITFKKVVMHNWEDLIDYDLVKFNTQYLKAIKFLENELWLSAKKYWYEICVVSECVKWEWVGFTWTIMSLLISWIYYTEKRLTAEDLSDYNKFQNSKTFKEINQLAHQGTIIAKYWNVGSAFYSTLVEWSHPYVYITDSKDGLDYKSIPNINEYGKQINVLFGANEYPIKTLPFCWALVYTGQKSDSSFAVWQKKFLEYSNLEYQKWFNSLEISEIDSQLKKWLDSTNYFETKLKNLNNMSINILSIFEKIYKKWAKNQYIYELINLMNIINILYNDIEQDFDITNDFQNACMMAWVSLDTFWFSPIYTNKYGWNYLVIFEDDSDLEVLQNVLDNMKNNYPEIKIRETYDFDTPAYEWLVIEQDITHNIWKESDDDLYILLNDKNEQKFVSYTDIKPKEQKWIFLDWVKNKIYIDWKVLTSKEIKSATTTIELFEHLLKSEDHKIKNNELWPSSFSSQQNQMESKIIIPLVKYIKKNLWKDFPMECSGSLREFYISLWKTDINISIVYKY